MIARRSTTYVDLELAGADPPAVDPGTAIHPEGCAGCQADHDGLLEAARRFGDARPESAPLRIWGRSVSR